MASDGLHTTNTVLVAASILKSFIASGVLDLPYAYSLNGWAPSVAISFVVMTLAVYCMRTLLKTRNEVGGPHEHLSYRLLADRAVGSPFFSHVVALTIVLTQLSFVCAYVAYISRAISTEWIFRNLSMRLVVLIVTVAYLPMALLENTKSIGKFSTPIVIVMFAAIFYILGANGFKVASDGISATADAFVPDAPWIQLTNIVAVASFSMEGVGCVLPLYDGMGPSAPKRFLPILYGCMVLACTTYVGMGLSGYLAFGGAVEESITDNITGTAYVFVQIAIRIQIVGTVPVMLLPAFRIVSMTSVYQRLWANVFGEVSKSILGSLNYEGSDRFLVESEEESVALLPSTNMGSEVTHVKLAPSPIADAVARAVLILLCGGFTAAVSSFNAIISLSGALTCSLIIFVFPSFMHFRATRFTASMGSKVMDIFCIIWGLFFCVAGTGYTIYTLVN